MKYKAIKTNCVTGIPKITEVGFVIRGEWLYISKGGITGFESARFKELTENNRIWDRWMACMGTHRRYDRLEVPIVEIKRFLKNESQKENGNDKR